jgi:large subunit ribosomal protein L3
MPGILGKKIGMARMHQTDGKVVPVTIISCVPNKVAQVKTSEKDGYNALVLGCQDRKHPTKTKKFYAMKEFSYEGTEKNKGDEITLAELPEGTMVAVSGVTRGKGFQGVMKRHNFHGMCASHGAHKVHRAGGSIGAGSLPGRVWKNKKMAGHMGSERQTLKNRLVVKVDTDKNLLAVKGPVPGSRGTFIELVW